MCLKEVSAIVKTAARWGNIMMESLRQLQHLFGLLSLNFCFPKIKAKRLFCLLFGFDALRDGDGEIISYYLQPSSPALPV